MSNLLNQDVFAHTAELIQNDLSAIHWLKVWMECVVCQEFDLGRERSDNWWGVEWNETVVYFCNGA